jgi:DNA-binding CsgD family transcriptional regulator
MADDVDDFERLSLCFRALGSGLWDYDIDADSLECDTVWYRILGLEETVSPVRSIGDFVPYIHPDDVARATAVDLAEIDTLIRNDERYYNEFRIVRPSGEVRLVRSVACVLADEVTGRKRAVGCITDLTVLDDFEESAVRWPMRLAPGRRPLHQRDERPVPTIASVALSEKEKECLLWVSAGKTADETAQIMGRSRRTIEYHINNSVRKLAASNKIHAVVIAIRSGIL